MHFANGTFLKAELTIFECLFRQESSPKRTISPKTSDTKPRHYQAPKSSENAAQQGSASGKGDRTGKAKQCKAEGRSDGKNFRNSIKVKQAIVSKLSETIGENVNCFGIGMLLTLG